MPPPKSGIADDEEQSEEEVIGDSEAGPNMSELMNNPELVAAVQAKLSGLLGEPSGFIEMLPECVKRRVNALKNIQVECAKLEGKFYEEAHQLEMKYAELFKPMYEKRNEIINASYEPTDEEAKWVEPGLDEDEMESESNKDNEGGDEKMTTEKTEDEKSEHEKFAEEVKSKLKLDMDENAKGIPEFWLTAMKNVELIGDMIQDHDEIILKHLTEVKLIFTGKKDPESEDNEMGFVLEFLFSANEHFTNSALTKTYKMKSEPDEDDPFSFEGPDIVSCTGCKIDWKAGKNITQKVVKKKQKHKGRGETRVVAKTVQNDSFFNFFDPPEVSEDALAVSISAGLDRSLKDFERYKDKFKELYVEPKEEEILGSLLLEEFVPENEDEMDEEVEALLAADFEIGHFFRERFIPKAVLFYTGEAIEDDESDDEFEDEESDDDDDDDDGDENDPDYVPPEGGEKPQECKQQ